MSPTGGQPDVVIVGGGFAGVACAQELDKHKVSSVLIDRLDYHQFQPMLYQLATGQVAPTDIAFPLRAIFRKRRHVTVKTADVRGVDAAARRVTTADGITFEGRALVLAAGARANFFGVPGAERNSFPLYSVDDANALRSRLLGILDSVDADPRRVDEGGLTFVVVGGGPTGVETAGALAEFVHEIVPHAYPDLPADRARVVLVDHGDHLLNGFSHQASGYAADTLEHRGVELLLGTGVTEVREDGVTLSDGSVIKTRAVVWGGGQEPATLIGTSGLPTGAGGRVDVAADLSVSGFPGVYVVGDAANIADGAGKPYPQLGSVAQQSGRWAGKNIVAELAGKPTTAFHYRDKGIMAMIGRDAAVAEIGPKRHEVDGTVAFAAWLGVHSELLSSMHQRVGAFVDWGWDYFDKQRPEYLADRPGAYAIAWDHNEAEDDGG